MLSADLSEGGTHQLFQRFLRTKSSRKASDHKEARTMRIVTRTNYRSYRLRPKTLQGRRSTLLHRRPSPYSSNKSMFPRMPERRLPNVVDEVRAQAILVTKSMHPRAATPFVKSPPRRARGCRVRPSYTANARIVTIILRRLKRHPLITLAPSRARLQQPLPRPLIVHRIKVPPRTASPRAPTTMALQPRPLPSPPPSPVSCTRTLHHRVRPTVVRRLKKNTPTRTAPTVGETATRAHSHFPPVLVR